jgi:exosortase
MSHKWNHDPQYSHGYLVPGFAALLLWLRRSHLAPTGEAPGWLGVSLLLAGVLLRLAGTYLYIDWLDAVSLVPCLAGLIVLLGGRSALRWTWPALAFLLFMFPLPYRAETALAHPLQRLATRTSTYALQTLGLPALAEGNTILLTHGRIGVVEACNGLSMMLIFFALATAVALLGKRPVLDRVVIVLSAVPIAILSNVARITATGAAYELLSPAAARVIFHDWAGWLMMPFALALLGLELWVLGRLLVEPAQPTAPLGPGLRKVPLLPAPAAPSGRRRTSRRSQPLPLPRPAGRG